MNLKAWKCAMHKRPYVPMTRFDVREIYLARDEIRWYKRRLYDAARKLDFRDMKDCRSQIQVIRQEIKQKYDVIL